MLIFIQIYLYLFLFEQGKLTWQWELQILDADLQARLFDLHFVFQLLSLCLKYAIRSGNFQLRIKITKYVCRYHSYMWFYRKSNFFFLFYWKWSVTVGPSGATGVLNDNFNVITLQIARYLAIWWTRENIYPHFALSDSEMWWHPTTLPQTSGFSFSSGVVTSGPSGRPVYFEIRVVLLITFGSADRFSDWSPAARDTMVFINVSVRYKECTVV